MGYSHCVAAFGVLQLEQMLEKCKDPMDASSNVVEPNETKAMRGNKLKKMHKNEIVQKIHNRATALNQDPSVTAADKRQQTKIAHSSFVDLPMPEVIFCYSCFLLFTGVVVYWVLGGGVVIVLFISITFFNH